MVEACATYKNHPFPIEIVAHAVWLYYRFGLSLRDVEEMLLERGIVVSYETIRRWGQKHSPDYARRLRRKAPSKNDVWHLDLDEVAVRINGRRCRLWRAVDQHGYVLDEIVQTRPNTKAARHLLIRLLKKQGLSPKRIVTDKLRSYSAATSGHARYRAPVAQGPQQPGGELSPAVSKAGANPARLPQHWLPQHFVSVFSAIRNLFVPSRSNRSATQIRTHRLNAMAEWKAAALQIA